MILTHSRRVLIPILAILAIGLAAPDDADARRRGASGSGDGTPLANDTNAGPFNARYFFAELLTEAQVTALLDALVLDFDDPDGSPPTTLRSEGFTEADFATTKGVWDFDEPPGSGDASLTALVGGTGTLVEDAVTPVDESGTPVAPGDEVTGDLGVGILRVRLTKGVKVGDEWQFELGESVLKGYYENIFSPTSGSFNQTEAEARGAPTDIDFIYDNDGSAGGFTVVLLTPPDCGDNETSGCAGQEGTVYFTFNEATGEGFTGDTPLSQYPDEAGESAQSQISPAALANVLKGPSPFCTTAAGNDVNSIYPQPICLDDPNAEPPRENFSAFILGFLAPERVPFGSDPLALVLLGLGLAWIGRRAAVRRRRR